MLRPFLDISIKHCVSLEHKSFRALHKLIYYIVKLTFVNKKELKNQNKLIKNYSDNRKLLKQKIQRENFARQQLQQSDFELLRLITKTFQEIQKKAR